MLYAIDNFLNYDIFYICISIDSIFFIFFLNIFVIFIFCSDISVQSCIILVRNGMFYEKHK